MQIYAIDVSKEHLDVFSQSDEEKTVQKRIKNNFNSICKLLSALKPDDFACAEFTGVYSNLLAHLCLTYEVKIALVTGFEIKHSLGNRKGKSDKIDAQRIWEYAKRFEDRLTFISDDNHHIQELKNLFNLRNQLVKDLKTFTSAHSSVKLLPYVSIAEHKIRTETENVLTEQIKNTENQLIEIIHQSSELDKNFELITSITGIGKITALELIITTGNFKRIDSARKAAAYAGVCHIRIKAEILLKKLEYTIEQIKNSSHYYTSVQRQSASTTRNSNYTEIEKCSKENTSIW